MSTAASLHRSAVSTGVSCERFCVQERMSFTSLLMMDFMNSFTNLSLYLETYLLLLFLNLSDPDAIR